MINIQFNNTHTILTEVLGSLQKMGGTIDSYFDHVNEGEILNSFLAGESINSIGNYEELPPEFFRGLGIRKLILDSLHGRLSLSEKNFIDIINKNAAAYRWRELKSDLIMGDLKMLFENSRIVEFAKWSDAGNASDIWDNLRRDVIMPLKRNEYDFIFCLGDTAKKPVFEVDEILDIISGYALHGRVTLILDAQNAVNLWEKLCGRDSYNEFSTSPGLNEKCRALFDLVDINYLIIDTFSTTLMFFRENQFEITVSKSPGISGRRNDHFDDGYILGLILKIDPLHSVALGLAVSGVYAESDTKPDSRMLLSFIEKWMGEMESLSPEESQLSFG
jgi:hypothetical protein